MPDAGHRQRIELRLAPPDPIRSRPLRTGKEFLLILREQRIVARTWNKALYDPDEEAQLAVTGKHLGDAPLRLVVEREEEGRGWMFVREESATVGSGGTEVNATFRFPARRDPAFKDGHFTKAEWDRREAAPGEVLRLHVEAQGLEAARFLYVVEREDAGKWVPVADGQAAVHEGIADARFEVPALPRNPALEARGSLGSATFEHAAELVVGETALAVARTVDLDGAVVCFELEREATHGRWDPVGWASSFVRSGQARAALKLASNDEPPGPLMGRVLSAAFDGELRAGAKALLVARAHGLEDQPLQFVLERESAPEQWEEIFTAAAHVADGRAIARAPLLVPEAKVARDAVVGRRSISS